MRIAKKAKAAKTFFVAFALFAVHACGGEAKPEPEAAREVAPQKPAEDYIARLVENRWDDLKELDAEEFSKQVVRWYAVAPDALDEAGPGRGRLGGRFGLRI